MARDTIIKHTSTKHYVSTFSEFNRHTLHGVNGFQALKALGVMLGDIGGAGNAEPAPAGFFRAKVRFAVTYGTEIYDMFEQAQMLPNPAIPLSERDIEIIDAMFFDAFDLQDTPFSQADLDEMSEEFNANHPNEDMHTGSLSWSYEILT